MQQAEIDPDLRGYDLDELLKISGKMYLTFQPRLDQPDRFDEQTAFYESKHRGITFLLGGNGAGTTTLSLAKMVKFILRDQEAPRPATPFWIISESFEMVMDVCWREKLWGNGLLPESEVDWDGISWHTPRKAWPNSVPLKPWPNGNSDNFWELSFKSYEQGRQKLQAASIGGFLFVEQAPYELILEVNRGARVYNYPGSKICEFTPIDPMRSIFLEEMIAEDKLPPGWAVYRCNTECAMEAGHVDKDWYEEFFASVPEEMREVRQIGAFASYEGLIYQSFNPAIHIKRDIRIPRHAIFKRVIDWGAGPDHPFVCLFAFQDAIGTWVIFDEYYSIDQNMTINDHAEAIKAMHDWPEEDPNYRVGYADPENPLAMREFARAGIPLIGAKKAVLEGINAVRQALKPRPNKMGPRLIIDGAKCPKTVMEFKTYRWLQKPRASLNPADAAPKPLKANDHCFMAGTMILTKSGEKPIESISVGEYVMTRQGWNRVAASWMTSPSEECFEFTMPNGRKLKCTSNHPIYTTNRGFVSIAELLPGDILMALPDESSLNTVDVESRSIRFRPERDFSETIAGQRIGGSHEKMLKCADAKFVTQNSRSKDTRLPVLAPVVVDFRFAGKPIGKHAVYNLTVENCPEYVANGVLVHNCMDAVRYLIYSEQTGDTGVFGKHVKPKNRKYLPDIR